MPKESFKLFEDFSESEDEDIDDKKSTLPFIEKYRPASLDEMISHTEIISTFKLFIKDGNMPHVLLYGPPGTGKTSAILACATEMYGTNKNFMVMELNAASDDRGIDVVRTKIKQFVSSDNAFYRMSIGDKAQDAFKLVILDEIDAMTDDAQAILRQVIEKYTSNARFCLICNYIKKINKALQSRCIVFRFSPLNKDQMRQRLNYVIEKENINITEDGIKAILTKSDRDNP